MVVSNGSNSNSIEGNNNDVDMITLNEYVISNLQMQFEKVAAKISLNKDVESACDIINITRNGTVSKKRKRAKTKDRQQSDNPELTGGEVKDDGYVTEKSTAKSAKRVRFSMKNNLFLCSSTSVFMVQVLLPHLYSWFDCYFF